MKKIILISIVLLVLASSCLANESNSEKNISELFISQDRFAQVMAFKKFNETVVDSERAAKLVEIWGSGTASSRISIRFSVLAYLMQDNHLQLLSQVELAKKVNQLKHHDNPLFRRSLLNLHARRNTEDSKKIVAEFLADKNEAIRHSAMISLTKQGNAEEVLQQYIKDNKSNNLHQESIRKAKIIIKNIKERKMRD